jgi:signal transduction histidine kinase
VITVADSGPGLPEEEVERIFTPFNRLETSRNRASGGAGLGVAIVKEVRGSLQGHRALPQPRAHRP